MHSPFQTATLQEIAWSQMSKIHLFYDGDCGFCHKVVQLVIKWAQDPFEFTFAPLGGALYKKLNIQVTSFDSVIVQTDTRTLKYMHAVGFIMTKLKPQAFILMGQILLKTPQGLSKGLYFIPSSIRYWLTKKPSTNCPVVEEKYKKLFFN